MSDTVKRFEEWEEVNCNQCAKYWDSSCDAVSKGISKPCTSFLATRSVVIPQQIKSLESALKWLRMGLLFTSAALVAHLVLHLFE